MDFNTVDKESLMDIFFQWHTHTYKSYPIALYINLLQVSDWNDFQLENESKTMEHIYRGKKYSQYFTPKEFKSALEVMRYFIVENTRESS